MPDYDDIDPMEGFEPDDEQDDIDPWEEAQRWIEGRDLWLPEDYIRDRATFGNPEMIRMKPFTSVTDALEYLVDTRIFGFSNIIFDDEQNLFFVAVGTSP